MKKKAVTSGWGVGVGCQVERNVADQLASACYMTCDIYYAIMHGRLTIGDRRSALRHAFGIFFPVTESHSVVVIAVACHSWLAYDQVLEQY